MEEAQTVAKEEETGWILKRRIQKFKQEQNSVADEIIFKTEEVHKAGQALYTRLTKPQKGYQFKPLECNKPLKLTLSAMKLDWETLSGRKKKMQEYCNTGLSEPEAWKHTPTVRTIIKGFLDDHIKQRCESSLDAANTVEEIYEILEDQEEIFWPQDKRLKSFINSTRKSTGSSCNCKIEQNSQVTVK